MTERPAPNSKANSRIAMICVGLVISMAGMAYAAVPLYDLFCRVTGYGGTTQMAANSHGVEIVDRKITVRFDANTQKGLGWDFAPRQRSIELKLGETAQIAYLAKNTASVPLTGTASFNVTPQSAGSYFNKIECFCFTETTLQPGEEITMPVVFFVDPGIIDAVETKDIQTITLSYTFFEQEPADKPVASIAREAVAEQEKEKNRL